MIWTDYGYGIVEDEKTVDQMAKKKYIKVKKIKKVEQPLSEENSKLPFFNLTHSEKNLRLEKKQRRKKKMLGEK
jgi:hypothetical protein